jgi:hypothetical protein
VHRDVASTVDSILRGVVSRAETRERSDDGNVTIAEPEDRRRDPSIGGAGLSQPRDREIVDITSRQSMRRAQAERAAPSAEPAPAVPLAPSTIRGRGTEAKPLRIYPFGISRNRLEQSIAQLGVHAVIVRDPRDADLVMTLKNYYRTKPQPIRDAEARGTGVYVLRSNTSLQMEHLLSTLLPVPKRQAEPEPEETEGDDVSRALYEAEAAISAVMEGAPPVSLSPQGSYVRRLQHQLADRYNLGSRSKGRDPQRWVEIYREGVQ